MHVARLNRCEVIPNRMSNNRIESNVVTDTLNNLNNRWRYLSFLRTAELLIDTVVTGRVIRSAMLVVS